MPRTKPYTALGIRRAKCIRCDAPAYAQWQICADDRVFRPICTDCDIGINDLVMNYVFGITAKTQHRIRLYAKKVRQLSKGR